MPTVRVTSLLSKLALVFGLVAALWGGGAPAAGRAQQATPVSASPGSLAAMLQLAPDPGVKADDQAFEPVIYADVAAQSAVAGIPLPTSREDPNLIRWANAMSPLFMPDPFLAYVLGVDWRALLGFDVWEIDQALQAGNPPQSFTLLRGRFDETAIARAWSAQGYAMFDIDGFAVASFNVEQRYNPGSDFGLYTMGRFNNATILPDGTLAYAPTMDEMRALLATARGTVHSLGDRDDVAEVVGAIEHPLASAILLGGAALRSGATVVITIGGKTPTPDDAATETTETPEMPPISLALLGVTAGGPFSRPLGEAATPQPDVPPATFEIALLLSTRAEAEVAARVAAARLTAATTNLTQRPFTDFFASWDARVLPDRPVAVLELEFAPGVEPRVWIRLVGTRDLEFLAW
jgi:hypothetical protein